jgi:hypothetical protein
MIKHGLRIWVFALSVAASHLAYAISDEQYNSIVALGELNGIALHCQFLDETRRMKGSLINALPKRRQLGEAFDIATNDSYLKFIAEQSECPAAETFTVQVDQAIKVLQQVFR